MPTPSTAQAAARPIMPCAKSEQNQPDREHEIGENQNTSTAAVINRSADSRTEKRRHQQRLIMKIS